MQVGENWGSKWTPGAAPGSRVIWRNTSIAPGLAKARTARLCGTPTTKNELMALVTFLPSSHLSWLFNLTGLFTSQTGEPRKSNFTMLSSHLKKKKKN